MALQSQCHGFLSNLTDLKFGILSKHPCGRNWSLFESIRLYK